MGLNRFFKPQSTSQQGVLRFSDPVVLIQPVGFVQHVTVGAHRVDAGKVDLGIGPAGAVEPAFGDHAGGRKPFIGRAEDAAIAEIERCAKAGAKGIGELRSDVQSFDLTDSRTMRPVVDAALKHDQVLLTHSSEPVGHEYSGKGAITPDILYSFITAFPRIRLVCAHWGGGLPFYALMPEVGRALANVFFDTAATVFLYKPEVFQQVSQMIGSDKILFGTDYPLMHQDRVLAQVQSARLPEEDKARILGANAQKLLYWDGRA